MSEVIKVRASVLAWRPCVNYVFCHLSQLLHFRKGKDRQEKISVFHICIMYYRTLFQLYITTLPTVNLARTLSCKTYLCISMHNNWLREYGCNQQFPPCCPGKKLQFIKHNDTLTAEHTVMQYGLSQWKTDIMNRIHSLFIGSSAKGKQITICTRL